MKIVLEFLLVAAAFLVGAGGIAVELLIPEAWPGNRFWSLLCIILASGLAFFLMGTESRQKPSRSEQAGLAVFSLLLALLAAPTVLVAILNEKNVFSGWPPKTILLHSLEPLQNSIPVIPAFSFALFGGFAFLYRLVPKKLLPAYFGLSFFMALLLAFIALTDLLAGLTRNPIVILPDIAPTPPLIALAGVLLGSAVSLDLKKMLTSKPRGLLLS